MKKLVLIALALVLAAAAAALWREPTGWLWGTLRRESFYDGKPTTYWERALRGDRPSAQVEARKALTDGKAAAVPVLLELLRDRADAKVRWTAAEILGLIGPDASA